MPLKICSANQMPSTIQAGMAKMRKKITKMNKTSTRALGKSKRYPPITPAIAPEAPTIGMGENGSIATCATAAARPERR